MPHHLTRRQFTHQNLGFLTGFFLFGRYRSGECDQAVIRGTAGLPEEATQLRDMLAAHLDRARDIIEGRFKPIFRADSETDSRTLTVSVIKPDRGKKAPVLVTAANKEDDSRLLITADTPTRRPLVEVVTRNGIRRKPTGDELRSAALSYETHYATERWFLNGMQVILAALGILLVITVAKSVLVALAFLLYYLLVAAAILLGVGIAWTAMRHLLAHFGWDAKGEWMTNRFTDHKERILSFFSRLFSSLFPPPEPPSPTHPQFPYRRRTFKV